MIPNLTTQDLSKSSRSFETVRNSVEMYAEINEDGSAMISPVNVDCSLKLSISKRNFEAQFKPSSKEGIFTKIAKTQIALEAASKCWIQGIDQLSGKVLKIPVDKGDFILSTHSGRNMMVKKDLFEKNYSQNELAKTHKVGPSLTI